MAIHLHRSNRTEKLVEILCDVLVEHQPSDPFQQFPIVVGSRGMERWLRHEIATRLDIAAGLVFPFPRQALAGAAAWLLDDAREPDGPFWAAGTSDSEGPRAWDRGQLACRVAPLIRANLGDEDFAPVARYLEHLVDEPGAAVSARELLFADEVADVLDRVMHERTHQALSWARSPQHAEPRHRWLATLLAELGAHTDPYSPAFLHETLVKQTRPDTGRSMVIFCLSTMGPGDRERLAAISRSIDVHLFVLIPARTWAHEAGVRSKNPVLASLATPSRDLDAWLEETGTVGGEPRIHVSSGEPTTLGRLQGWVLESGSYETESTPWPLDGSLTAHSTFGALRQCEVLRDQLLALFDVDPTLEPRDIAVMTPDIETYAPLIAAVFARREQTAGNARVPAIPVTIADLGIHRTNPVAEVLLKGLEIVSERLTATWILDFLGLRPVRRRWNLSDDDLTSIRRLVCESGLRWAYDADDRAAVDQPALDQNTVRFALERLALGALMADEDDLAAITDGAPELAPAVPYNVENRDRVALVGALTGVLRTLVAHRSLMSTPATLGAWRMRLETMLDELTATTEKTGWLRAEVDAALEEMGRAGEHLGDLEVEKGAVLRWLRGGFEIAQRGDRPITGAVQVCGLEPMRSVPFRVIALVGMDDKVFPRVGRRRTWDPMETALPGERDRREVDRHLLLEALLSARDHLLVFWSGRDVQQGKDQPAAVPVEELLDVVGQLTNTRRHALVQEHPLQPWSAEAFSGSATSFDHNMALAARRLTEIEAGEEADVLGLTTSREDALPEEKFLPESLEITQLADALIAAQRMFLRDRLGLIVEDYAVQILDREPFVLDNLEVWSIRNRMVSVLMNSTRRWSTKELAAAMLDRLRGEGSLPFEVAGRTLLEDQAELALTVPENWELVAGEPSAPLELNLQLEGEPHLVGRVEHTQVQGDVRLLQWYSASKQANQRTRLITWISLLTAVASGNDVTIARVVTCGPERPEARVSGAFFAFDGGKARARAIIADLFEIWRVARRRPIPLFKRTSDAACGVLGNAPLPLDDDSYHALAKAVRNTWYPSHVMPGEVEDPWVAALFADYDPGNNLEDEDPFSFIDLARRVWLPIHQASNLGNSLRREWQRRARA